MSRPKKTEIREWIRDLKDDLIELNDALRLDDVSKVQILGMSIQSGVEEILGLCEERYEITIECPDIANPVETPAGENEETDEEDEENEPAPVP